MTTLVAVSQRVDVWADRGERRDALDQRLTLWLLAAGMLPAPVPNGLDAAAADAWLVAVRPAAIVLSGGNDIGEAIERDRTEEALLAFARDRQLPLLGICRGLQMLARSAGDALKPVAGHVRSRHRLRPAAGVTDLPDTVNSFHAWGLAACPPGFDVLACAEDGEIEAIAHRRLPWEGWMWHPEREGAFAAGELARLRRLFERRAASRPTP